MSTGSLGDTSGSVSSDRESPGNGWCGLALLEREISDLHRETVQLSELLYLELSLHLKPYPGGGARDQKGRREGILRISPSDLGWPRNLSLAASADKIQHLHQEIRESSHLPLSSWMTFALFSLSFPLTLVSRAGATIGSFSLDFSTPPT
jgi:hypothetical protein